MHLDDLRSHLADALDTEPGADLTAGRHAIDRRVRRHQTRRVGVVATVVALLLGTVGLGLRTGRNDTLPVLTGPSSARHLVPTVVVEGVADAGTSRLPIVRATALPMSEPTRTFVYGRAGAPDAVNGETFAVLLLHLDAAKLRNIGLDPGPVAVAGTTAVPPTGPAAGTIVAPPGTSTAPASTGTQPTASPTVAALVQAEQIDRIVGPGGTRFVRADAGADWAAAIVSRTVSDATLAAVGRSITPSADRTALEQITIPDGFAPIAQSSSFAMLEGSDQIVSLLGEGSIVGMNDDNTNSDRSVRHGAFVAIVAVPGHAEDLDVIRWFLTDEQPMRLHDRDGFGGTFSVGMYRTGTAQATAVMPDGSATPTSPPTTMAATEIHQSVLAWTEPDGTLMVIQAEGYSPQELARIADGLVAVDDDAWQRRVDTPPTLPPGCEHTAGGGTSCSFHGTGTAIPSLAGRPGPEGSTPAVSGT